MIGPKAFYIFLRRRGINFFAGVPDSLLKHFCAYITDTAKPSSHIIAANEGGAVALAAGYHLATGKIGLVYMQNSGQGNSLNPLVSLADLKVYGIPMLLLIGWRGEPGVKDEPQHKRQGEITLGLLKTLGIPFAILPRSSSGAEKAVRKAVAQMKVSGSPYAFVVKKNTFAPYKSKRTEGFSRPLAREEVLEYITDEMQGDEILVSTTGKTARELFEIRERSGRGHEKDFLTVGSMGHSSQIALGIALAKSDREVYCLDGDGAFIMHMGAVAVIGNKTPRNFKHIVLNNFAHESVGGQPTAATSMDIPAVARACGYKQVFLAQSQAELRRALLRLKRVRGPALLEIRVRQGSRDDLGRPTLSPKQNKELFMEFAERGLQGFFAQEKLRKFLEDNKVRRIFLVTGGKSYASSGAERMFGEVLSRYQAARFNDFSPNPKLEDVERGIKVFREGKCDAVVAVGGGSTIDMAKLINIFSAQKGAPVDYIRGKKSIKRPGKALLAVPTTAGTGSEATHFAVVYVGEEKYSVAHKFMLPSAAIIEPELVMSMPRRLAASSGMDALSQAIESYWCVNATDESKRFAARAIGLILDNFAQSVKNPTLESRAAMMLAAHLAGKAINVTKTTAPHAISYFFTSHFGIPHGHAVALTLGHMFLYNSRVTGKDCADKRGAKYVKKIMDELLDLLGVKNAAAASRKISDIMRQTGLETRLHKLGIQRSDIDEAVKSVNAERLQNNPRRLDGQPLERILLSIL